jgi:nucleoside-diphosphate-sugar epimerase
MERVVVTGAAGAIGKVLVASLFLHCLFYQVRHTCTMLRAQCRYKNPPMRGTYDRFSQVIGLSKVG